jgi:hypothetical protein
MFEGKMRIPICDGDKIVRLSKEDAHNVELGLCVLHHEHDREKEENDKDDTNNACFHSSQCIHFHYEQLLYTLSSLKQSRNSHHNLLAHMVIRR